MAINVGAHHVTGVNSDTSTVTLTVDKSEA